MDSTRIRFSWWALAGLLFGVSTVTGIMAVQAVEYSFHPVVANARVTRTQPDGDGTLIWGTFDKVRDCHFVEATASSGAILLDLEFLDTRKNRAATRPTGPQLFGPWRISPSTSPVRITTRHECQPLWYTTSTLLEGFKP